MRVLIVGGTGFIGSHVVDLLRESGIDVLVFARGPERFRPPLPLVSYLFGDLSDPASIGSAVSRGIDAIVHLASTTVPETSNADPLSDIENLHGFVRLLQLCVKGGVRKVVLASSGGTVYGIPNTLPVSESHPTDPICAYGVTKLAMEKSLQCCAHLYGLQHVILRLANVYGIRQDPARTQGAIAIFIRKVLQGESLTVWGDGSIIRDFVHVRDVARLISAALHSPAVGVFNAGSGTGISINELLHLISEHLDVRTKIVHAPPRKFDVPAIVLDCQKARSVYSWQSQVNLGEGLAGVADWLKGAGKRHVRQPVLRTKVTVG